MQIEIKHLDRCSFIELLQYFIDNIGVCGFYHSVKSESMSDFLEPLDIYPRFDLVLSGSKHMKFPGEDKVEDLHMQPGDVHFCPPHNWKCPVWDSPHEFSSLIYTREFIRMTYMQYDKNDSWNNRKPANIYYHTATPPVKAERGILDAFMELPDGVSVKVRKSLFDALIRLTVEHLKNDNSPMPGKADITWERINLYLRDNFHRNISRDDVADSLNITPCYISKLFSKRASETFNGRLRRLRLEYMAVLLETTDLTIDEMTLRCGYQSTNSVISAFKRIFKMPPGEFRSRHRKKYASHLTD